MRKESIIPTPITKAWEKGKEAVKNKEWDEARDFFDFGIAMVAQHTLDEGLSDKDYIEGVRREVWLTRFWKVGLENNNLLL